MMSATKTIALVTACTAIVCPGVGVAQSQAAATAPPPADRSAQASRAWEENGMQVIQLAPARRTSVYATRGPDGSIEITHAPAVQPHSQDD